MVTTLLSVSVLVLGIDANWKPTPDGGVEYEIYLAPHELTELLEGRNFRSEVPPSLRDVRAFTVMVVRDESLAPRMLLPDPSVLPLGVSGASAAAVEEPESPPGFFAEPRGSAIVTDDVEAGDANSSNDRRASPRSTLDTAIQSQIIETEHGALTTYSTAAELRTANLTVLSEDNSEESHVDSPEQGDSPPRPWLPLTFTLLFLFASLGGNVYLGWVCHGYRRRLLAAV